MKKEYGNPSSKDWSLYPKKSGKLFQGRWVTLIKFFIVVVYLFYFFVKLKSKGQARLRGQQKKLRVQLASCHGSPERGVGSLGIGKGLVYHVWIPVLITWPSVVFLKTDACISMVLDPCYLLKKDLFLNAKCPQSRASEPMGLGHPNPTGCCLSNLQILLLPDSLSHI